ncbi:MAG: LuxR family transcriptional regulator [Alphaproteobacteria bacterium]|nr:MAG: LuxR family transcriptional regulator [Alphaproteobacteria bacterium]
MKLDLLIRTLQRRRASLLVAIIVVQAICAIFFIGDLVGDFQDKATNDPLQLALETAATIALAAGVVYLSFELRDLLMRMKSMELGLRAARGEAQKMLGEFFEQWGLTPSERDVALFILKGLDNDAIAQMRGTAPSTVRVQAARVYAKAGVSGRAQLFSVFMDELLAGERESATAEH